MNQLIPDDKSFNDALCLMLNATSHVAPRGAIGWCLLDIAQQVIACDAVMAGTASTKLARVLQQHSDRCHQLLLTLEPVQGFVNGQELIRTLDNSFCQQINVAYQLDRQFIDRDWLDWKENWSGTFNYLSHTYTASQLAAGIESVKVRRRPWVMAVCAADWSGRSLLLNDLCEGFAIREQLLGYASQSRAVLYASDQTALMENLPDSNSANEPITPFEIYESGSIQSLLNYLASEFRCNCVVYTNTDILRYLLAQELVDEVIYYLADFVGEDAGHCAAATTSTINFKGWETTSCSKAGDGCRLVLRRKPTTESTRLHLGLN